MSLRVGVVGATGYVGAELARWILGHPHLTLSAATSRDHAGAPLAQAVPALEGFTDVRLSAPDSAALCALDVVMLATPHGVSRTLVGDLATAPIIVDLSRDHRHAPGWVYGQPEWNGAALPGATRIAAPGCFATALILSTAPLIASGAAAGPLSIVAATGSTGSGATPKSAAHHPTRFVNLRAYKVLQHQHIPEVRGMLEQLGQTPDLRFVPWSAPVDRGIFATTLLTPRSGADIAAIFADAYETAPLVRLREESPALRCVRGSVLADIAVEQRDGAAAVLCAIDNLGRGAAGQAIAALNLALGLPADEGLRFIPLTP
ncbi:MAG: N-acetyl-gamma-glutamyl-phosphate reductase [Myxococcota bacterium]|nr:N-acetyl-gamma-glutamyl-phosphate reductase [Myxococcota bacterium]